MLNIVRQDYLVRYLHCGDPAEERYARDYTLFAVAEYLCWAEIVRRELRFLDLGNVDRNRELLAHLTKIQVTLQSDQVDSPLRIFRGRQRAIAEVMTLPTTATDGPAQRMPGLRRLHPPAGHRPRVRSWFAQLGQDIDVIATNTVEQNVRLVRLQRDLDRPDRLPRPRRGTDPGLLPSPPRRGSHHGRPAPLDPPLADPGPGPPRMTSGELGGGDGGEGADRPPASGG